MANKVTTTTPVLDYTVMLTLNNGESLFIETRQFKGLTSEFHDRSGSPGLTCSSLSRCAVIQDYLRCPFLVD
jgi:hypothetical protein